MTAACHPDTSDKLKLADWFLNNAVLPTHLHPYTETRGMLSQ